MKRWTVAHGSHLRPFQPKRSASPPRLTPREYKRGGKVVGEVHGEKPGHMVHKMRPPPYPRLPCRQCQRGLIISAAPAQLEAVSRQEATAGATTLKDMPIPKIENREGRKHGRHQDRQGQDQHQHHHWRRAPRRPPAHAARACAYPPTRHDDAAPGHAAGWRCPSNAHAAAGCAASNGGDAA